MLEVINRAAQEVFLPTALAVYVVDKLYEGVKSRTGWIQDYGFSPDGMARLAAGAVALPVIPLGLTASLIYLPRALYNAMISHNKLG